jgi:hypothetical protein
VTVSATYAGRDGTDAGSGTSLDDVVQPNRTVRDGIAVLASPCAFKPRELFAAALHSSKVLSVAFNPATASFVALFEFGLLLSFGAAEFT